MRISRILAPVTALGPGRRVGLWVQGCDLACPGCASTDTWNPYAGTEIHETDVANQVLSHVRAHNLTGLTISGGEPFQQPDALTVVIDAVKEAAPNTDVLAFTGYTTAVARRRSPELINRLDILIAGRYDQTRPSGGPLLASDNQEVTLLTELGRQRFTQLSGPRLQVTATEDQVFILGLPEAGDLQRLEDELRTTGIHLEGVSWRA
ncbi:4Fe-4S single cluster domain-containing protein [Nocardioides sp. KR10-350]|uniref:4Fe-4S single cluster domain-containing protein n=1 Tax=Nocardioides cheoyonin TaxID=3156615 RepID=UPI0032B3DAEE